jgi:hypothetical protein
MFYLKKASFNGHLVKKRVSKENFFQRIFQFMNIGSTNIFFRKPYRLTGI